MGQIAKAPRPGNIKGAKVIIPGLFFAHTVNAGVIACLFSAKVTLIKTDAGRERRPRRAELFEVAPPYEEGLKQICF